MACTSFKEYAKSYPAIAKDAAFEDSLSEESIKSVINDYIELSNGNLVSYYDKGKRLSSLSLSSVDTYINRTVHDISNDTIVFTYTDDKLPPKSINLSKYGKDKYVSRAELKPNDKTGKRNKLVLFYNDHS